MDRKGKEFKYPLARARGSVVRPAPKIVPNKQEVSAEYYEWHEWIMMPQSQFVPFGGASVFRVRLDFIC
jgi:hypothetical protein